MIHLEGASPRTFRRRRGRSRRIRSCSYDTPAVDQYSKWKCIDTQERLGAREQRAPVTAHGGEAKTAAVDAANADVFVDAADRRARNTHFQQPFAEPTFYTYKPPLLKRVTIH